MKEQALRVNISSPGGPSDSIQIEFNEVPNLNNYSIGDSLQGEVLSETLNGRSFRITGAQNNTGAPHVPFLNSNKYCLLGSSRTGNRRNIRGQRVRRLLLSRNLGVRLTCLNLVETT